MKKRYFYDIIILSGIRYGGQYVSEERNYLQRNSGGMPGREYSTAFCCEGKPMMTRTGARNFFMALEFNVTSSFYYAKVEMPIIQRQIQ